MLSWVILHFSATHTYIHAYSTKTRVQFTFMGVSAATHCHLPEIWVVICFHYFSVQWSTDVMPSRHQQGVFRTHTMWNLKKKKKEKTGEKKWNRANAQGKYNTISTSTVARRSWSQQNTENTLPCFSAHRNPFMQVKWYGMFILFFL